MVVKLCQYVNEVLDIAEANKTDRGVAVNMFINNVKDVNDPADQYKYHGADYCNYAALNASDLEDGKNEFLAILDKKLDTVVGLHKAGKRAEAVAEMLKD